MDALKCYNSDSESSFGDEELNATNETLAVSKDLDSVQKPKCDFFNLQDSDGESESEMKLITTKTEKTVNVGVDETFTIPVSDFWNPLETELNESDLKSGTSCSEIAKDLDFSYDYKETHSRFTGVKRKNTRQNLNNVSNTYKLKKQDEKIFLSTAKHSTDFTNQDISSDHLHIIKTDSLNREEAMCSSDSNKKRKLLDVHGKISPWLNRQDITYKIPKAREKSWKAHDGAVTKAKWNVKKYSHLLLSVSMDATVKIWNVWSNFDPCIKKLQIHSKGIQDGDWSVSGRHILTCSYDKTAVITDIENSQPLTRCYHKNYVTCGNFHPTKEHIFVTGSLDELKAWDTRQGSEPIHVYTYKDKIGQIQDVIFNRDGTEFFSTGDLVSRDSADRNIMAWDFEHAIVKSNQIYQERYSCTRLKLHPVDSNFLAQSHGNYIALFSAIKPYKMCRSLRYEGHKLAGYKLGFDISPDGRYVVSGDSSGSIYSYDYKSGQLLNTLHTNLDVSLDVAFHSLLPSSLVCCGWNGFIELWH